MCWKHIFLKFKFLFSRSSYVLYVQHGFLYLMPTRHKFTVCGGQGEGVLVHKLFLPQSTSIFRGSVSAFSAGGYTTILYVMVDIVKEIGPATPPTPPWLIFPSWWNICQKVAVVSLWVCTLRFHLPQTIYQKGFEVHSLKKYETFKQCMCAQNSCRKLLRNYKILFYRSEMCV